MQVVNWGVLQQKKWVENASLAEHGEDAKERQAPLGGGSDWTPVFSRIIRRKGQDMILWDSL